MSTVLHYEDEAGRDLLAVWLNGLRDQQASARIAARIQRLELGLFGDCKPLDAGVWELKIDCGAGYRVYYAQSGKTLILLLAGGDKRTQKTDIAEAKRRWQNWQRRQA